MRRQVCCSSVSCTFWSPPAPHSCFHFCSSDKILSVMVFTQFLLLSNCCCFYFIPHSIAFSTHLSLCFPIFSHHFLYLQFFSRRDERICCFFPCSSHGSFILSFSFPCFSNVFVLSPFSPSLLQFSVLRWKDHSCLPFVVSSQSFSSGSLPHAASLTAWVKRTDPLRIANMLRVNRLNYAHCGGEHIHNTGIKLLKVMQYLALQLPAVYRISGMFCQTDMHMSNGLPVLAVRLSEWTTQLPAYIGLQWFQERNKMTVCWQALLQTSKRDFNTLTTSEPRSKNILYTWQNCIAMCRDFDSV